MKTVGRMNKILERYFADHAATLKIDGSAAEKYEHYMELVLEYNKRVNLTAITDQDEFAVKNIIDSLDVFGDERYQKSRTVIDVGTGAGLPGIPLALASPDKEFVLMDSLSKRVKIVETIARELGLSNVTAVHSRAEDLAGKPQYREHFDLCVSRAVSRLNILSEYCLPFVRKGGWFVSYKGKNYSEEVTDAANALKKLGGRLDAVEERNMKEYGLSHVLLYIFKYKSTPNEYPRRAGIPQKKPL